MSESCGLNAEDSFARDVQKLLSEGGAKSFRLRVGLGFGWNSSKTERMDRRESGEGDIMGVDDGRDELP